MPPKCDELSQDELRKKLYRTFKDRGVLDTLKTQLRNLLVRELLGPERRGEPVREEGRGLLLGACNALVADHLRRAGYEYALAVFLPESGLGGEEALSMRDLLRLVQVDPASRLHRSLISGTDEENQKGLLLRFLQELAAWRQAPPTRHVGTQTDARRDSLAEKLRVIDDAFADARPRRPESLEAKLSDYKRDLEQRLRAEMQGRLRHLRDTEVARVQAQERRRRERELAELRGAFESAWRAKAEALASREKEAVERFRRHEEVEAKEIYAQRQLLLKDMDSLREREAELKQRVDAFELNQRLHEEQNRSAAEALRRREQDVKRLEDTYDRQLKDAVLK